MPHQASQPGDSTKRLGLFRDSDLEGQQDLIIGLPQDWGNKIMKDSTLAGHKQNLACTKTQRKGAVTYRRLNKTYLRHIEIKLKKKLKTKIKY